MKTTVEQEFELHVLKNALAHATKEELIQMLMETTELLFISQNAIKETIKDSLSRGIF